MKSKKWIKVFLVFTFLFASFGVIFPTEKVEASNYTNAKCTDSNVKKALNAYEQETFKQLWKARKWQSIWDKTKALFNIKKRVIEMFNVSMDTIDACLK